ncbi:MAG: DNA primase [Ardenticatenaceae bacterium]|nr:DNA primase [Ardenticatenaceae bacterium]MCB9445176.1 DNA primase [Ardenticatenaceae bacterium]
MSVTEEIKSRLDIVDIVSDYLPLRKSGRSFAGFCPFHQNTRTPAFYVFPETQTWHCFGACAEGGDIFSFVMKKEGWDFKETLQKLADKAGVELESQQPMDSRQQAFEGKMASLLSAAADYFNMLFLHAPQAAHARQYVAERALNEETIDAFKIGFALNEWNACRSHFQEQGYSDSELLAAGLLTENPDKGTRYDRFRNRLMIPIRDVNGRTVGFGARTLEKDGIPKYLNSPQTELFDKSSLLYGLDGAKRHIREARQVVIVEGYMDVMQGWQAGFRNMVAQMGTALTEPQLRQLKRYTKRFILALDADAAGQKATMRGLQVARETLDREVEVKFDARGLVHHEGRLQADIRIVTLPEGNDPDKIIRTDATAWPKLLEQAQPVVAYVIKMATQDLDMSDAKAKTAVAQQVLPLIKDISDPVERDHYWQELARALRVDERALRQIQVQEKPQFRPRPVEQPGPPEPPPPPDNWEESGTAVPRKAKSIRRKADGSMAANMREANYLSQCLHHRTILIQVNQRLRQNQQPEVNESDFTAVEDRLLLKQLYEWQKRGVVAPIAELCDSLDEALNERAQTLLTFPPTPDSELDRLADKLALSVLNWRQEKIGQLIGEIKQLFRQGDTSDDVDASEMYDKLNEWKLTVLNIHKAKNAMSAVNRRRAENLGNGRF